MICRKCHERGQITVKKDYTYCESCYLVYLNHRFRACIGKNKVVNPNEKILIGLSGGLGSTALLDLIHTGITLNSHKKLRIDPQFVHLTGDEDNSEKVSDTIQEQCRSYGLNVHIYNISNYIPSNTLFSDLTTISKTKSNDFPSRIIQNALASVAKDLSCRLIFTAEPATNLAAKLLSDIVIGRGSQVENDIGFTDNRYENKKILRPLRDITKEELQHYLKIKGLIPACNNHNKVNNLQSVINRFVDALERDSPATISTICKTADKIGSVNESEKTCMFCKGRLDMDAAKLTSIQAIIFSRAVSSRSKQIEAQVENINTYQEEITDQSMFPYIQQHLCYCCSRNYAELDDAKLRNHIIGMQGLLRQE